MTTRIGVLTAGGDAPGLNAAIRAVVRTAIGAHGFEVLGFRRGWRGVMEGDVIELTSSSVQGILHRGGTILGSSGADPYHDQGVERVREPLPAALSTDPTDRRLGGWLELALRR